MAVASQCQRGTKGGLMYEASVGGQKFSYTPLGKTDKDKKK